MAVPLDLVLPQRKWVALGNQDLPLDEVEAGHHLGHWVLDLQPRVHLQEEELLRGPVAADEELHRAGPHVADRRRERHRRGVHPLERLCGGPGGRRLLDDLLVPALDRALALEEVDDRAVSVAEDLHLHVPRPFDVALEEHRRVTEGRLRLAARAGNGLGEVGGRADDAHPLATAPCGGLHQHRVADLCTPREQVGLDQGPVELHPGNERHAGHRCNALGLDLEGHRPHRVGCRPDPDQPGIRYGRGEVGVLREEAVPGVHGIGTCSERGVEHLRSVEVRLRRRRAAERDGVRRLVDEGRTTVRLAEHRNGLDAELVTGSNDASRDLAAVGDEQSGDRGHVRVTSGRRRRSWHPGPARSARRRGRA